MQNNIKLISPRSYYTQAINESGGYFGAKSKNYSKFMSKYFSPIPDLNVMTYLLAFRHLMHGKIYTFNYSPVGADKLDFYDTRPIIISIKHFKADTTQNEIEFGLNLNFMPPKMKAVVLERLYTTYYSIINANYKKSLDNKHLTQRPLFIGTYDYMAVLDYLWESVGNTAYRFAIRNYIRPNMSNIKEVAYEDWGKIMFIDSKEICGASLGEVYKKYWDFKNSSKAKG